MKRLIPSLKATGNEITNFTQSSWLATPDNIDILADKIRKENIGPDTVIILELFGNSTFRYRQFDGTMALPFKSGHGYHLEGEVGVCDDATFVKLCGATKPVLDACGPAIKILVPPLPRHIYTGCCASKNHCTNRAEIDYELKILQQAMHFRPLLKETLLNMGLENFFVLDGIGGLLGVPAGSNRGPASEIVTELRKYCAIDGVHFNEIGYANLGRVIFEAISGIKSGTLTRSDPFQSSGTGKKPGNNFFWRGFTSPVGHTAPKNSISSQQHRAGERAAPTENRISSVTSGNNWEQPRNATGGQGTQHNNNSWRFGPHRGPAGYMGPRKMPYWKK
jgi:hypothetical protein